LVTLVSQGLIKWWRRPILEIRFDEKEPGCLINTNVVGGTQPVQCYVRLKIRNSGRTTAKDVSLCVVKLKFEASGRGTSSFEEEVLDLKLAMTTKEAVFRLANGAHRYIDLSHTQSVATGVAFGLDFVISPVRLGILGWGAGTYRAEVVASADNAASVHRTVSWAWDGQFLGLRVIGIANVQSDD
jgi:hypothetical protein